MDTINYSTNATGTGTTTVNIPYNPNIATPPYNYVSPPQYNEVVELIGNSFREGQKIKITLKNGNVIEGTYMDIRGKQDFTEVILREEIVIFANNELLIVRAIKEKSDLVQDLIKKL